MRHLSSPAMAVRAVEHPRIIIRHDFVLHSMTTSVSLSAHPRPKGGPPRPAASMTSMTKRASHRTDVAYCAPAIGTHRPSGRRTPLLALARQADLLRYSAPSQRMGRCAFLRLPPVTRAPTNRMLRTPPRPIRFHAPDIIRAGAHPVWDGPRPCAHTAYVPGGCLTEHRQATLAPITCACDAPPRARWRRPPRSR